jgi:hypothetical protein
MINEIGDNAGKVWSYLKANGKVSFKKLIEGTSLKDKDLNRAVGWLARENKLGFETGDKKQEVLFLTEQ